MAKQKLSIKAKAAKARRDLKAAKTPARRAKKAENQRKRSAAVKAGKNVKGKDFDQKEFEKMNLSSLLTPGRNNGVHSMPQKIKFYARENQTEMAS